MDSCMLTFGNATLKICIDKACRHTMEGRILGQRLSQALPFDSMGHLLLVLERLMDAQNFPQAYQRIRSFDTKRLEQPGLPCLPIDSMSQETVDAATGSVGTFLLRVTSRNNATWQGTLEWLDRMGPERFSSDLEFLTLVDKKLFPAISEA